MIALAAMLPLPVACSGGAGSATVSTGAATTTSIATRPFTTVPFTTVPSTTVPSTTVPSTTVPPRVYVFPFVGTPVGYGTTHHDYPAVDVFGCGAIVVAPTDGIVLQTRDVDRWDPNVNSPSTRGGKFVSMLGGDGVRYYFSHLGEVSAVAGLSVQPGDRLGVMGQTGNARSSVCHTHFGISRPCPAKEWKVRRGEVWPAPYLNSWRTGGQPSPALAVFAAVQADPTACSVASADPDAVNA